MSATARRELVSEYGFDAPEEPGGQYVVMTPPADDEVLQTLAAGIVTVLMNLYGASEDSIGWRTLPD